MKPKVDVEFERSAEGQPTPIPDRDPLDRDRHYGGEPALDQQTEVDPEREQAEWEKRYGTEESRDKIGFDGGS
ncbi:MAG TPA: hypothetical protein VEK11_22810 [Thermoanaerobaculia bacterium]|nr:hypothetical protein [Thermoanaerobaculia bacterium]